MSSSSPDVFDAVDDFIQKDDAVPLDTIDGNSNDPIHGQEPVGLFGAQNPKRLGGRQFPRLCARALVNARAVFSGRQSLRQQY
jgi:hypothetical protein